MACDSCHTPRGPDGALVKEKRFAGGSQTWDEPAYVVKGEPRRYLKLMTSAGLDASWMLAAAKASYSKQSLLACPATHEILFDQPEVIASADQSLCSAGLAQRCQTVAGSFLEFVPEDGDAML